MTLPLSARRTPHAQDLAHFSRQLAEHLDEPPAQPLRALYLTGQLSVHPQLRQLTAEVAQDIKQGLPLEQALAQAKYIPILGHLFAPCLRDGTSAHHPAQPLHLIADYYEREAHLTQTVQQRLLRPLLAFDLGLLTLCGLLALCLPLLKP